MPREASAGGIVFRLEPEPQFLVILDGYGCWTFPKGVIEEGETPEKAAVREIEEETGVRAVIVGELGETRYVFHHPRRGAVHKTVTFYLLRAEGGRLTPQTEEIAAAEWVAPEEAARRVDYDGYDRLVEEAVRMVRRLGQRPG